MTACIIHYYMRSFKRLISLSYDYINDRKLSDVYDNIPTTCLYCNMTMLIVNIKIKLIPYGQISCIIDAILIRCPTKPVKTYFFRWYWL